MALFLPYVSTFPFFICKIMYVCMYVCICMMYVYMMYVHMYIFERVDEKERKKSSTAASIPRWPQKPGLDQSKARRPARTQVPAVFTCHQHKHISRVTRMWTDTDSIMLGQLISLPHSTHSSVFLCYAGPMIMVLPVHFLYHKLIWGLVLHLKLLNNCEKSREVYPFWN